MKSTEHYICKFDKGSFTVCFVHHMYLKDMNQQILEVCTDDSRCDKEVARVAGKCTSWGYLLEYTFAFHSFYLEKMSLQNLKDIIFSMSYTTQESQQMSQMQHYIYVLYGKYLCHCMTGKKTNKTKLSQNVRDQHESQNKFWRGYSSSCPL